MSVLEGFVDARLLREKERLSGAFREAEPFPHLVLDSFFDERLCRELLAAFPPFALGDATSENGIPGGKATVQAVRSLGAAYERVDDVFRSQEFRAFVSAITGIPDLIYDPEYVGGGTHENLPGQDLDPHVDFNYHPTTGLHRRLNLIVYLNPAWEEAWGGSLELHTDPWLPPEKNAIRRVLPKWNRAVVFETSERSWHGFEAIRPPRSAPGTTRKSLALYMYTKERPAVETAGPHSTVYVERPLPFVLEVGRPVTYAELARIQRTLARRRQHVARVAAREDGFAGQVAASLRRLFAKGEPVSEEDVALLSRALARDDARLKELYGREQAFTVDLGRLVARVGDAPARDLAVLGPARLASPPRGYFDDGWCAPLLELDLVATARASRVVLHGHLGDMFPSGQTVTVESPGGVTEQRIERGFFRVEVPFGDAVPSRFTLRVRASAVFEPRLAAPSSPDDRELAYQLLGVESAA